MTASWHTFWSAVADCCRRMRGAEAIASYVQRATKRGGKRDRWGNK